MLSMQVLTCVTLLLPSLGVCERFFIGGCRWNFDSFVDPIAHTEQGLQDLKSFSSVSAAKLYLWEPNNNEKEFTNMELSMLWPANTFSLAYNNGLIPSRISGTVEYQFAPKMALLFRTLPIRDQLGIFSFNKYGEADIYPVLITPTDIILRGCVNVLLGRVESLYVFTNQDYSALNASCTIQKIKEKYDWEVTRVL